jgi:hypothetical protein
LLTGGALAQTASRLQVSDGVLQIDCHQNLFGFAVHPMDLPKEPEEALVAELAIQVEGAPGASWAPGNLSVLGIQQMDRYPHIRRRLSYGRIG